MNCDLCGEKVGMLSNYPMILNPQEYNSKTVTLCGNCYAEMQKLRKGSAEAKEYIHKYIDASNNEYIKAFVYDLEQSIDEGAIKAEKLNQEKKQKKEEERNRVRKRAAELPVTTCDIQCAYDIVGPVYAQVNNKGVFSSQLDDLLKQYTPELTALESSGQLSSDYRADWGFLWGEWSVGQSQFEKAFFVATQMIKERAAIMGADAVIGMRQDIDIDTNGFSYFYLQMYGTSVKFKDGNV